MSRQERIREKSIERAVRVWAKSHDLPFVKMQTVERGFPDRALVLPDSKIAWLEFKTSTGVESKHQSYWLDRLQELGHCAEVARSKAEVAAILSDQLDVRVWL